MANVSNTALPVLHSYVGKSTGRILFYVIGEGVVKLPSVTKCTGENTILTDIKEAR